MAGSPQFVTDEQILGWLCRPYKLGYIAVACGTSLQRLDAVLTQNKVQVLRARVEVHKQRPEQICYQLGLIEKLDSVRQWYRKHYEQVTNETSSEKQ